MFSACITPPQASRRPIVPNSVWFSPANPPKLRYFTHDGPTAGNLAIPAGDSDAEVVSEMTAMANTQLVYLQPHMHLRGKDYEVRLIYPSGKTETIFKAPWDFNWQIGYDLAEPIPIPKGTRIVGIAHYDNSANNKWNPDPMKLVVWGNQNWEEMQNCFMSFLVDPKLKNPGYCSSFPGRACSSGRRLDRH